MRRPTSIIGIVFFVALVTGLAACGKGNNDAPLVDSNGKHPAEWIARHGAAAIASTSSCVQCHADDLSGGIAKVSCMSAAAISGFGCHATSPAANPSHSFHPGSWIGLHGAGALASTASCTQCHATDLSGGIAKVSCMSATAISGFGCHATSPAASPSHSFHPGNWIPQHGATALSSTSPCVQCHAADLSGGIAKVSCMSATAISGFSCHATSPATNPSHGFHQVNWLTQHGNGLSSTSVCTPCHSGDLTGGIAKVSCISSGISGLRCHFSSPAANPGCSSCHGTPPDGKTAPNRANAHAKHMALAGVTCSTCHNNAGAGTAGHSSSLAAGATISLPNGLKAKTITMGFGYDTVSGKCSGIICHGGQTTPSWSTGAIVVNTDCRSCHELGTAFQTPQYNSYYSGKFIYPGSSTTTVLHQLHLSSNDPTSVSLVKPLISCTSCHNTVKLSPRHFSGLTTPAFDEPPGNIPGGGSTNITLYTPYTTAVPSGSCVNRCHAVRYWQN